MHYGAEVAGPVFKEIADRLYTTYVKNSKNSGDELVKNDSSLINFSGNKDDITYVMSRVGLKYKENVGLADDWINSNGNSKLLSITSKKINKQIMPLLKGMNIKDAVYLCESIGLKTKISGKGKVNVQSIEDGAKISFGQTINLFLN